MNDVIPSLVCFFIFSYLSLPLRLVNNTFSIQYIYNIVFLSLGLSILQNGKVPQFIPENILHQSLVKMKCQQP